MKIISNQIRPVGYITIELSENEVQTIISAFEEVCYMRNRPYDEILGTRREVYDKLKEAIDFKNQPCKQ
jgi:hypothetical protein